MKYITSDRLSGFVFILLSAAYGYFAQQIPLDFFSETEVFNARSLPTLIAIFGVAIGLTLLVSQATPATRIAAQEETGADEERPNFAYGPLLLISLIFCYAWLLPLAGFLLSTSGFLWLSFLTMGERRWIRMILVAVALPFAFQWLISSLGIYLDPGHFGSMMNGASA